MPQPSPSDGSPSWPIHIQRCQYREVDSSYSGSSHRKSCWQWYHVVYGLVVQRVDGIDHTLEAGCGLLIPPGRLRQPHVPTGQARPPGYFWVQFALSDLDLSAITCRPLRIPPPLEPDLDALVDSMRRQDLPHRGLLQHALVLRLLLGLHLGPSRQLSASSPLNAVAGRRQVAAACTFIDTHLADPISRDDIAHAAHCSPAHLARLFQTELGRPVGAELIARRLARAKDLLLASERSITEIAGEVGYDSYSHFSHIFRREIGISPSAYRRARGRTWR